MVIFEYILAVKEPKFSHFKGDEMVFVPGYRIRREKGKKDFCVSCPQPGPSPSPVPG